MIYVASPSHQRPQRRPPPQWNIGNVSVSPSRVSFSQVVSVVMIPQRSTQSHPLVLSQALHSGRAQVSLRAIKGTFFTFTKNKHRRLIFFVKNFKQQIYLLEHFPLFY